MSVNRLWGKTPNVLEQRLLVALYHAGRPMTHAEIFEMAANEGLLNPLPNLAALREKGLVVEDRASNTLTAAGAALTKVCLEHNLFSTLEECRKLTKHAEPVKPKDATPEPAAPKPWLSTEEKAAARLWDSEMTRAEALRLAQSPKLAHELKQVLHSSQPSSAPVTPLDRIRPGPLLVVPPVVTPVVAPVVEQPKPKPVASTPKSSPKPPPPPPTRRPPPPPPPRFRK